MKYLLNFALLFIALNATAQTNYLNGYIVTNNNDTTKGFIHYKDLQYTIQTINLKTTTTDQVITYGPADVKELVVDNNTYLSYTGRVSNNKNNFPEIDIKKDTTTTHTALFLQLISSGPNAALYINNDKLKTRFFLKEKNSTPVELIYYEYANTGEKLNKISAFMGPLTEAFNKYNSYNESKLHVLHNTHFTQSGLETALSLINNNITDKHPRPSGIRFFAGFSIAQVHSSAQPTLDHATKAESTNISPKISLGFDFVNNPDIQKVILRAELSVSYFSPTYTFSYNPNGINNLDNNKYMFDQYSVSFAPQILYNIYNGPKLKFFVSGGISFGYAIYPKNEMNYNKIVSFTPYTVVTAVDNSITYNALNINLPIQAGVVLNRDIELAVNYMPALNAISSSNLKLQAVGLSVRYLFKR